MTTDAYQPADVHAMLELFIGATPAPRPGTTLLTLGSGIREYLRAASGRALASPAKVALTVAVLDLWAGFSDLSGEAVTEAHVEAAALITIGAATATLGRSDDEAGEIVALARGRVERAIGDHADWQELWSMSDELGRQIGFRIDVDGARAERVWRALLEFAADESPIQLDAPPPRISALLRTVQARSRATLSPALAAIKSAWPAPSDGAWPTPSGGGAASGIHPEEPAEPWELQECGDPDEGAQRLRVWFGTNRGPTVRGDITSGYTNALAPDELLYGHCLVNVPAMHDATGGFRRFVSGWLRRGTPHGGQASVEAYFRFADDADFTQALQGELAHADNERTALVFIHGYNTSFAKAATTAAQLSVNVKHRGPTAMFSWASRAKLRSYRHDERMVDVSRPQLIQFLQTLTSIVELDHVDLVVRSLGNRLFLQSLIDWFQHGAAPAIPLRNLFLGAPDVAQTDFHTHAAVYAQAAQKTTLYGSDSDSALLLSKAFHQSTRVGLMPPPTVAAGVDTIETSAIDVSALRHNGIVRAAAVQSDIFSVQKGVHDPNARPNLRRVSVGSSLPYWRF